MDLLLAEPDNTKAVAKDPKCTNKNLKIKTKSLKADKGICQRQVLSQTYYFTRN